MKKIYRLACVLAASVLLSSLPVSLLAQEKAQENQRDRQTNEATLTGCLNKDTAGTYTLTDEKRGTKTSVTGSADLEKHSANHRVTLTGTSKPDASGRSVFEVSKIQHMGTSCKAGGQ